MIESYADLHALIKTAATQFSASNEAVTFTVTIDDNQACTLKHNNGSRMTFMFARFGNEFKVGYAFFEFGIKNPDWIDDAFARDFDEAFIMAMLEQVWGNQQSSGSI